MTNLAKMSNLRLHWEHFRRLGRVDEARDAYLWQHTEEMGRALLEARQSATESALEMDRRGLGQQGFDLPSVDPLLLELIFVRCLCWAGWLGMPVCAVGSVMAFHSHLYALGSFLVLCVGFCAVLGVLMSEDVLYVKHLRRAKKAS